MLISLREYQRPGEDAQAGRARERLDRALALLARPRPRTVALAGGNTLLGSDDPSVEAVVDLQGLGLDEVAVEDPLPNRGEAQLRIGAMASRTVLADLAPAKAWYAGVLAEGARRWGGSVQRNQATVGGAVAVAAANDPLVVALLVCDAAVVLYTEDGPREMPLSEFLPSRQATLASPALITDILVPAPAGRVDDVPNGQAQGGSTSGGPRTPAALVMVGRTPHDAPIVVAAACLHVEQARCTWARLALGGIAAEPQRLAQVEDKLAGQELSQELIASAAALIAEAVQPAGDFRGSTEYRRAVAQVLGERALLEAWEKAR